MEDLLLDVTQGVFHLLPPGHHVAQVPHLKRRKETRLTTPNKDPGAEVLHIVSMQSHDSSVHERRARACKDAS